MNTRIVGLHNSQPFAPFFGRPFPGLKDFSEVESMPMGDQELTKRIEYLCQLVIPAISERSKATQQRMIERFNASHKLVEFPPGSWVIEVDNVSTGTLDPKYEGPFKVVRQTERGAYVLRDSTGELLPRDYAPSQLKSVTKDDVEEGRLYEVESVLADKFDDTLKKQVYLVRWKGYSSKADRWIPYENFDSKAL
ncbi:hypothetical protein DFQ26_002333, partial [Actinomortierella ambigua]